MKYILLEMHHSLGFWVFLGLLDLVLSYKAQTTTSTAFPKPERIPEKTV